MMTTEETNEIDKYLIKNWDLLNSDTKRCLEIIGVRP